MNGSQTDTWGAIIATMRAARPQDLLATHNKVARAVAAALEASLPTGALPLNVALLRTITAEVLENSLVACLAEFGLATRLSLGRLGNLAAEILDDDSFVYQRAHDVCIVLALAEHLLPGLCEPSREHDDGPPRDGDHERTDSAFLAQLRHLADRFPGLVIVCNFALPEARPAPRFQAQKPTSGRYAVGRANARLARLASQTPNLVVCDVEALVGRIGAERFYSRRDMATAMQPFSASAIPALARELALSCALYRTTPVKCIVLDCDNTLWGGIVGEDGLSSIQLGETYPGLCFQQFQAQLDELNRLGFLLALNSKNNEADVRQVFEQHPGMVLKTDQFAAARINWGDKAANLREIADELNIGLDSFVFVDDSAFEINLIRSRLPEVRCLQVPEQPWALPHLLPDAGIIDRLSLTVEDRGKTRMYVQERRRREFRRDAGTLEDYLRALDIRLTFEPFAPERHLARAAQLTQKTNQFNLTTRRYSEADIVRMHREGTPIFLASLADRFGDYGRTALAILRPAPASTQRTCRLDVFLLSCRVIGRGVENSFLHLVMDAARGAGFERMDAEFIPTAKNAVCAGFLADNNFAVVSPRGTDVVSYCFDLTGDVSQIADWISVSKGHAPDG